MFDRVSEKTLPVTVDSNGLSVADGYMLYRSNPVPSEVTITGPQSELDAITSVVAPVTVDSELSDSTSVTTSLDAALDCATPSPRSMPSWTTPAPT